MKFYGKPNELVVTRKYDHKLGRQKQKILFYFDNNGEYETDNPELIEKLKPHFRYEETESAPKYTCKKCDFATNNKGELLAHYREKHPKEG